VQSELGQALDVLTEIPEGDIFLIPARLEECQIPYEELRSLHRVDLFPSSDKGAERNIRAIRGTKESANSETLQPSEVGTMIVVRVSGEAHLRSLTLSPSGEFGTGFTGYRSQHSEARGDRLTIGKHADVLREPSAMRRNLPGQKLVGEKYRLYRLYTLEVTSFVAMLLIGSTLARIIHEEWSGV
jgi:hypothetical protein